MSSYFVNPTFPGSLPSGQDSFLGQLPLYPAGYDALRPFPASYGASSLPDKTYTSPCFYQQSNSVLACNRASYEYGASCFYSDKDLSGASPSGSGKQRGPGDYLHFSPEQQYKPDSSSVQGKALHDEGTDRKYTSPVYPWMQRMNSCAGKAFPCTPHPRQWRERGKETGKERRKEKEPETLGRGIRMEERMNKVSLAFLKSIFKKKKTIPNGAIRLMQRKEKARSM